MVVSSTFKVGQIWLVNGNTTSLADIHVAEFLLPQQQQSNTMNVMHAIMNASDDETDTPSRQEQERPAQQCFMEFDLPQQYHSLQQQQQQQTPQNLQSNQVRLQPHHELFQDAAMQTPVRSHADYQAPHVPGLMTQSTQSHALPQPAPPMQTHTLHVHGLPKEGCADIPLEQLTSDHDASAFCKLCSATVPFSKGATTQVRRHMEVKHSVELRDFNDKQAAAKRNASGVSLTTGCASKSTHEHDAPALIEITAEQQNHANQLLAVWVATSLRPFTIVEDEGFIAYAKYISEVVSGVKIEIPSRIKLREDIVRVAIRLRATLLDILKRECRYYSVTTDIWTSRNTDGYMALTLHYVTIDFRIRSWTLEVQAFAGRHTGEAIATALSNCFYRWGLDRQLCVKLVRDGASNAVVAGELFGVEHMSCVAHSLHLVLAGVLIKKKPSKARVWDQRIMSPLPVSLTEAFNANNSSGGGGAINVNVEHDPEVVVEAGMWQQERTWNELAQFLDTWTDMEEELAALNKLRGIVQKFRDIAVYVHKSAKTKSWLDNIQKERYEGRPLRVIIDCPTRWNSARNMLARMLELKEPLHLFFAHVKSPLGLVQFKDVKFVSPEPSDWFSIKCLLSLLDPFAAATEELSGDSYPTLAVTLPFLRYIKGWLDRDDIFDEAKSLEGQHSYVDDTLNLLRLVQQTLSKLFKKRFENLPSDVLWISLLDPRLTGMDALDDDEKSVAKVNLIEAAIELARELYPPPLAAVACPSSTPVAIRSHQARSNIREGVFGKRVATKQNRPLAPEAHARRLRVKCETEVADYFARAASIYESADDTIADTYGHDDSNDPLLWWKCRSIHFPVLSQLARKWLGCVATSVPSERAFSTAGNIVSAKRSALDPDAVRDLIFIHENYADERTLVRYNGVKYTLCVLNMRPEST
ncbi:unnamed protein product [Phytophthora fragariaefolia]|uniref:Unnamed protein product n=1 Tax=Phytophthora fragariaefolia TaxID=1490495 RepID=A0A9W6XFA4_9STRA|nr:unnamed protein product [Phytophthora fragariaefolia]